MPIFLLLIRLQGSIDPATSHFLANAIHEAERTQAQALIVELDTPGGLVTSVREMAQNIDAAKIPVIVYVAPAGASATSAGALLTLASHVAAMAPGTNIGAAHPVGSSGEDIKGTMGQKVVNDVSAFARGLAELRKRNVALAEAVVSRSKSLTAEEALRENLVEIIAPTREGLLSALDGRHVRIRGGERVLKTRGAETKEATMSFGEQLLHTLANPNIAALLMTFGMLLIYVEVSNPGLVVPGIAGAVSLLVAFMAFQMLPIRVGALALVLLGTLLMLAEPFVISHGALAVGGIVSFLLGLIWLIDPAMTELRLSLWVWFFSAIALGGLVTVIAVAASRIRKLSRDTLAKIGGAGVLAGVGGYPGIVETVTPDGRQGKARFRGEIWDIESDLPLQPGDEIRAEEVRGIRLRVRRKE